jgi:hypothetical protein
MMQEYNPMEQLRVWMMEAQRPRLLAMLAVGITEMTIHARLHYDGPDVIDRLRETNEAIHRLTGHLRDLCDPNQALTDSRADAVIGQLRLLGPSAISRLIGSWPNERT